MTYQNQDSFSYEENGNIFVTIQKRDLRWCQETAILFGKHDKWKGEYGYGLKNTTSDLYLAEREGLFGEFSIHCYYGFPVDDKIRERGNTYDTYFFYDGEKILIDIKTIKVYNVATKRGLYGDIYFMIAREGAKPTIDKLKCYLYIFTTIVGYVGGNSKSCSEVTVQILGYITRNTLIDNFEQRLGPSLKRNSNHTNLYIRNDELKTARILKDILYKESNCVSISRR